MKEKMVDIDRMIIPEWMKKESGTHHRSKWQAALDIVGGVCIMAFVFGFWVLAAIWTLQ